MTDSTTPIVPRSPTTWTPPEQVLTELFCASGIEATGNLDKAIGNPNAHPLAVWVGRTLDTEADHFDVVPGMFWIPAVLCSWKLLTGLDDYIRRKNAGRRQRRQGLLSRTDAIDNMKLLHSGIGNDQVVLHPFAFVEIDHLRREEQEARYHALSLATGLQWCLWVFTGGKSVHAYLRFATPLEAGDPLWKEIQELLIVVLVGDTKITNASRLMRLPGWAGADRQQPVVHYDPTVGYEAEDVRDRLVEYAAQMGITDVKKTLKVLRLAERLDQKAKHEDEDDARQLQEQARLLRSRRGDPDDADIELAHTMLGRRVQKVTNTLGQPVVLWSSGSGESQWLTPDQVAHYGGLGVGTRCDAPCCVGRFKMDAQVYETAPVRLTCFRCDIHYYEPTHVGTDDDIDLTEVDMLEVDAVINSLDGGDSTPVSQEEARVSPMEEVYDRIQELEDEEHRELVARLTASFDHEGFEADIDRMFGRNVPASLVEEENRLEGTSPVDEDPEVGEAKRAYFGMEPGFKQCGSAPTLHRGDSTPVITSTRGMCFRTSCIVCGPKMVKALRASASVMLRVAIEQTRLTWDGAVIHGLRKGTASKAVQRWVMAAPERRMLLGFATNPDSVVHLVLWADGNEPTGKLLDHLKAHDMVEIDEAPDQVIDRLAADIDLDAWRGSGRRATILRGTQPIKGAVAGLRDAVLGRSRARGKSIDPSKVIVATMEAAPEVQGLLAARYLADAEVVEKNHDARKLRQETRWNLGKQIAGGPALQMAVHAGVLLPARRKPAENVPGIDVDDGGVVEFGFDDEPLDGLTGSRSPAPGSSPDPGPR